MSSSPMPFRPSLHDLAMFLFYEQTGPVPQRRREPAYPPPGTPVPDPDGPGVVSLSDAERQAALMLAAGDLYMAGLKLCDLIEARTHEEDHTTLADLRLFALSLEVKAAMARAKGEKPPLTFAAFKATGTDHDDLAKVIDDCSLSDTDRPVAGRVYCKALYIEKTSTWPTTAPGYGKGRWYTLIGRSEYQGDDLEEIELRLWEFAYWEGYEAE